MSSFKSIHIYNIGNEKLEDEYEEKQRRSAYSNIMIANKRFTIINPA
jgi:hypothetical protein